MVFALAVFDLPPQIFGLVIKSTGSYSLAFVFMGILMLIGIAAGLWLRHLLRKTAKERIPSVDTEDLLEDRGQTEGEEVALA